MLSPEFLGHVKLIDILHGMCSVTAAIPISLLNALAAVTSRKLTPGFNSPALH